MGSVREPTVTLVCSAKMLPEARAEHERQNGDKVDGSA